MKRYLLLFILAFLMNQMGLAQPVLSISQSSLFVTNDTLPSGSSDSISFQIVNEGTVMQTGPVTVYAAVQDSAGTFVYWLVDSVTTIPGDTIYAGDSLYQYMSPTYVTAPTKYHYDINVIVIWPVAAWATTGDSATYIQVITDPNGIGEIDLEELIRIFPNPATDNIQLRNDSKMSIEEVRIYDSRGRFIRKEPGNSTISTSDWATGVYWLNVITTDKRSCTIRLVKQ